jgi:hypothetical protein
MVRTPSTIITRMVAERASMLLEIQLRVSSPNDETRLETFGAFEARLGAAGFREAGLLTGRRAIR